MFWYLPARWLWHEFQCYVFEFNYESCSTFSDQRILQLKTILQVIEKSQKSSRKTRSAFFRKFFGRVATENFFCLTWSPLTTTTTVTTAVTTMTMTTTMKITMRFKIQSSLKWSEWNFLRAVLSVNKSTIVEANCVEDVANNKLKSVSETGSTFGKFLTTFPPRTTMVSHYIYVAILVPDDKRICFGIPEIFLPIKIY